MESITKQLREMYSQADEGGRQHILNELRDFEHSVDERWDVIMKLASAPIISSLGAIGINLGIFRILTDSPPLSSTELAQRTGAAPGILRHILRCMATFALIKEAGKDQYTASHWAKQLSDPSVDVAISPFLSSHMACISAFEAFLKERNYTDITSNTDTVFQKAFNTSLPAFEWMAQQPELAKALGQAMAIQRKESWVDSYPVEEEVSSFTVTSDNALLVDVGGGFGQQAIAFKNRFPNLQGRIIVEDIPATLAAAKPVEGIEFLGHDFFTPQPIKGAKFYYLRHILHDWPTDECIKILKNLVPALGPDSRLLIDDIVLPDTNVPWQAAYLDVLMLISLGGMERTREEWEDLFDQAGLKIERLVKYDPKFTSIITVMPK